MLTYKEESFGTKEVGMGSHRFLQAKRGISDDLRPNSISIEDNVVSSKPPPFMMSEERGVHPSQLATRPS